MTDVDFIPKGATRPGAVYISKRHGQALRYVSLQMGESKTREDIVAAILDKWLTHNHPEIMEFIDQRDAAEKEFQKTLASNARETKPEFVSETPT